MKIKFLLPLLGLLLCSCQKPNEEEVTYPKIYEFGDYSNGFTENVSDYIIRKGDAIGFELIWVLREYDENLNVVTEIEKNVDESCQTTVTITANDKAKWVCANLHADIYYQSGEKGSLDYYTYPPTMLAGVRDYTASLIIKPFTKYTTGEPKFD